MLDTQVSNNGVFVSPPTLSEIVTRNVVLATTLEPIGDKPGCTTRYTDLKPSKALEYFITAGVNIGPAFTHLTDHLLANKTSEAIYRYYVEAIAYSKTNRAGGKINQGIIEPLIPIATAIVLSDPKAEKSPGYVLREAKAVMKTKSRYNVEKLVEGKKFANALSIFTKHPVGEYDVDSVYEYYEADLAAAKDQGVHKSVSFNGEYVDGFPRIARAYQTIKTSKSPKLMDKTVDAYLELFKASPGAPIGVGSAADYIACAVFLYLSYAKDKIVVV